jgi:hypothetical protein
LIVLDLNKATLTIESDADDVPMRIMQGDKVVERLTVSKSGVSLRAAAGRYVVEIEGEADEIAIENGVVSLQRGGREVVRIVQRDDKTAADSQMVPGSVDLSRTNRGSTTDAAVTCTPLLDAIREFNERQRRDPVGKDQPPLTDDEVIASIRWAVIRDGQAGVSDPYRRPLRHLAEQRQLSPRWADMPPLTEKEVIAAIRFQKTRRDSFDITDGEFARM